MRSLTVASCLSTCWHSRFSSSRGISYPSNTTTFITIDKQLLSPMCVWVLCMYCLLKSLQNPLKVCSMITSNLLKGNWSKKQLMNFPSYPDHKHHSHLKRSVSAQRLQVAKYSSVIKMAKGLQPDWGQWVPRHSPLRSLHSLRYGLALGYQDWRAGRQTGSHYQPHSLSP